MIGGQQGYDEPMGKLNDRQVPRELEQQGRALDELHETVTQLESRTAALRLGKPEATSATVGLPPREVQAELADQISTRTDSIRGATARLRTILAELEI